MTDWSKLDEALLRQKCFSDFFFITETASSKDKEEQLKTLALALHAEVTGIVEGTNYKSHRCTNHLIDTQKILYKSVDAYRYVLSILNLWGISASTFSTALSQKDDFLHMRHKMSQNKWDGQPVALFDMDDVIAEFRQSFCGWVSQTTGCDVSPQSRDYYNAEALKKHGLDNEVLFRNFIDQHGFLLLERCDKYVKLLDHVRDRGYWIQLVTARPESNLTAFYDTYSWVKAHGIDPDGIAFTPEKFAWLTHQPYYTKGKYFAVDDSSKHAAEYAKHGVITVVPEKSYNTDVKHLDNIVYVSCDTDPLSLLDRFL